AKVDPPLKLVTNTSVGIKSPVFLPSFFNILVDITFTAAPLSTKTLDTGTSSNLALI
ncbi:hypothetical protein LINPERPRIM_LOCUS31432, partial [Linum perenne]